MTVRTEGLEDVYRLSPLQHGMLYHNLYAPGEGNYIEQSLLTLRGRVDRRAFWQAWDTVVARHAALRTTFHWDEISKPVQAVHRQGALVHDERDLSGLSAEEQVAAIDARFLEERRQGFDLEATPPMRVTLYRLGDDRHQVALRFHHLILDGWSVGIVLSEFMTLYKAGVHGRPANLPLPGRYRDYVAWWSGQRPEAAEGFWRSQLSGYTPPAEIHLGGTDTLGGAEVSHERENSSLAGAAEEIRAFSREHRLTANTLIQTAWAAVLAACVDSDDVVVGITFAHRPAELAHAEATVGCMVSTVPVRTPVRRDQPAVAWLRQVQDLVIEVREHSAVSLVDIQSWSGVPRSAELFESLVAFQNVPLPEFSLAEEGLELEGYVFDSRPHVPFSLAVLPGADFPLRLVYDRRRLDAAGARLLLGAVREALLAIVRDPHLPVGELLDRARLGLPATAVAVSRTAEQEAEPGAPRNETEAAVAALMAELLESGPLGVHDNLVDAGLHSLLGTQVVNRVMERWKTPVSLRALFEEPTVAGLAALIEGGGSDDAGSQVRGRLDLVAETSLGEEITPGGEPGWVPAPERVLLIGATGFAGTALLARLLSDTGASVACLVRCEDAQHGRSRVRQALEAAGWWREEHAARIEVVPGNLARPALGLTEAEFAELGASVDEIYHVGGVVNILSSYRRVMRTIVEGAREVLRLAVSGGRATPVHYLSAAALTHHPDPALAGRELPLDPDAPAQGSGYMQAKWVADRMMTLAQSRGVPVVLYRASRLIGTPGQRHWKLGDGTSEILRVCAALGAYPDCDVEMTASPVDGVAAAIAATARRKECLGGVHHLVSPRPFTFLDVGQAMRACGYSMRAMSLEAWYAELVRMSQREPAGGWETALAVLGPWVRGVSGGMREPAYEAGEVQLPPIDVPFLKGCVEHLAESGHITVR